MTGPLLFGGEARPVRGGWVRHYWVSEPDATLVRSLCASDLRWMAFHSVEPREPSEPDRPVCAKCERARARTVAGG